MVRRPDSFVSQSPEETMAWAMTFAHHLSAGTVLALHGDLGAGKTCLVQGLARGLDVTGMVHSPTFTLIHEYRGRLPLYHLDLYRLHGPEDAWEIGIEQYLPGDGITAVEWPERITSLLPESTRHLLLRHGDEPHVRIISEISADLL
ncbi:MAG TPA: tRNA (adenosine(37)-N6)-threonylcarbamoyltransferase complex ATPase subunit type 1 TsaE [Kiritimatiellia bacterium]|nr:tRNA (adenosine(37)-N6)-threonylcarbamoyltransferase complex ATPase subunit type 1 TsaE [Kiritimatiellia bacterium]HMO99496.1 tRNA (adenosine(37)-N6)-threonylcarbamoyltransferase complex ATPase subunit type 1 TsaE [Kiritimatiellia bacterium]HMP97819.1 tRNA (adenosine(37)-N6)-threonylcarbamoyltransferase complex ATPase subunit type 1 TsaE [Kiritimatiellia bacterium]